MESQEKKLLESVESCHRLLEQTVQVKSALRNNDTKNILGIADSLIKELGGLQEQKKQFGRTLSPQASEKMFGLHNEWLRLHGEALRETKGVLSQLKAHMAVTRQELAGLSNGKKIAAGYHSNIDRRGRKLNING